MSAVKYLKLKFPGATIAEKTGYNKATISEYLKKKAPSEAFIRTFSEQFGLSFEAIWEGTPAEEDPKDSTEKGERFTADQLFAMYMSSVERQEKLMETQLGILRNIESKMAREVTLADVALNLQRVFGGVETMGERQEAAIKTILSDLNKIKSQTKVPS